MDARSDLKTLLAVAALATLATLSAGCKPKDSSASTPTDAAKPDLPRFSDGTVRFDRSPGEHGYWDSPSVSTLFESGAKVDFEPSGKLKNSADAAKVAPFQPWALALYQYRQQSGLADDPMHDCIGPGLPRAMSTPGGVRIIQDRNYKRAYVLFGGGNRTWRVIYLDGRSPRSLRTPSASTRASGSRTAACRTPKPCISRSASSAPRTMSSSTK
jgi:hypothetical protein